MQVMVAERRGGLGRLSCSLGLASVSKMPKKLYLHPLLRPSEPLAGEAPLRVPFHR